jgi:hypothetical protein
MEGWNILPLAELCLVVNDRLGALNIAETLPPRKKHLICSLWKQASNVDVSLSRLVLEAAVKGFMGRARSWNRTWYGWFLAEQGQKMWRQSGNALSLLERPDQLVRVGKLRWGRSRAAGIHGTRRTVHDCRCGAIAVSAVARVRSARDVVLVGGDGVAARGHE